MRDEPSLPKTEATDVGLVLVDLSFKTVAMDPGAAAILALRICPGGTKSTAVCLPKELLDAVGTRIPDPDRPVTTHFRMGSHDYLCRAFLLEPRNSAFPQPMLALHLRRNAVAGGAIREIATQYRLTTREQEVLEGISLGFDTKDLARRLNISPSTVKAFLRLIMVKLGVNTRSELFAIVLKRHSALDGRLESPVAHHPARL